MDQCKSNETYIKFTDDRGDSFFIEYNRNQKSFDVVKYASTDDIFKFRLQGESWFLNRDNTTTLIEWLLARLKEQRS